MAKRGGGSGRKYARDAIGRFASKGYGGQTSGRGARLKAKGKKRDGGGAIVKPSRIGEMKNTISKSSSKRKVNASSRATDRQIARDVAARAKKKSVTANSARGQDAATGGKKGRAKAAAAKPAVSSARDAATVRLKIKTATRRKLKADRSSVIPANPKARRVQGARIGSTVAKKARAKGNAPATIANRVRRKAAVNKANLKENTRYGNVTDGKRYMRQVKTSTTLDRAQNFLKTGQKGKPTEKARRALSAAKRAPEMAAARTRLAAKRRKAKPAAAKRKSKKVSADKVSRIADRVNKVSTTTGGRKGVKALNRIQVAVRAKGFLSRKAGGVSGLNSSGASRADKIKSVQSSINTRIKYSTQKPNRNKPDRFNNLGQSSLRAKNKIAAQTPRQKIAAAKPVKAKPSNRMLGRRELLSRNPVSAPNTVRASGLKSTVKRSKAPKKSSLVVRTRQQSKAAQKFRRESVLTRTRKPGSIGLGGTTPNARVKRQRTGTQLSLLGKAAPLYKFRPVKRRRS